MSGSLSILNTAIILGWVGFALLGWVVNGPVAVGIGLALAVALLFARKSVVMRAFLAILEPVGLVLPLLAIRHMAAALGVPVTPFAAWELTAFLILHVAFLAAAMGVIPVNVYRIGYEPRFVAVIVLALCAYGYLTGTLFIPLVAVLGQAAWIWGRDSSNYFDHILHVVMVPIAAIVLLTRLL